MFPILPILILLLLGPANAERLANEGRLPAGLLAVHRALIAPARVTIVAPVVVTAVQAASPRCAPRPTVVRTVPVSPVVRVETVALPASPIRAGPRTA